MRRTWGSLALIVVASCTLDGERSRETVRRTESEA